MPKEGFKSITVSHAVYDRFNDSYISSKEDLAAEGVRSITGYISNMIEEALRRNEAASKHARLRLMHVSPGLIIVMDAESDRVAEVVMQDGEPFCHTCGRSDCLHAGFAHATHRFFLDPT